MACHQIDVFLCKTVHALTFRDEVPDIFMILLQSGLLIGNVRIAVKDIGTMLYEELLLYLQRIHSEESHVQYKLFPVRLSAFDYIQIYSYGYPFCRQITNFIIACENCLCRSKFQFEMKIYKKTGI